MHISNYCQRLHFQSLFYSFCWLNVPYGLSKIMQKITLRTHYLCTYLSYMSTILLKVPQNYSDLYPHVQNKDRKIYSGKFFLPYLTYKIKVVCSNIISHVGMVTALDEATGRVISSLKKNGLYKNTIIVFSSDVSMHSDPLIKICHLRITVLQDFQSSLSKLIMHL